MFRRQSLVQLMIGAVIGSSACTGFAADRHPSRPASPSMARGVSARPQPRSIAHPTVRPRGNMQAKPMAPQHGKGLSVGTVRKPTPVGQRPSVGQTLSKPTVSTPSTIVGRLPHRPRPVPLPKPSPLDKMRLEAEIELAKRQQRSETVQGILGGVAGIVQGAAIAGQSAQLGAVPGPIYPGVGGYPGYAPEVCALQTGYAPGVYPDQTAYEETQFGDDEPYYGPE